VLCCGSAQLFHEIKKGCLADDNPSQHGLNRITCNPRYKIEITLQKAKLKKLQSSRLNNLMSRDKIEKKINFKKSYSKKNRVNTSKLDQLVTCDMRL